MDQPYRSLSPASPNSVPVVASNISPPPSAQQLPHPQSLPQSSMHLSSLPPSLPLANPSHLPQGVPTAVPLSVGLQQQQPHVFQQVPVSLSSQQQPQTFSRPVNTNVVPPSSSPAAYPRSAERPRPKSSSSIREPASTNGTAGRPREDTPLKPDGQMSLLKNPHLWLQKLASVFTWKLLVMIVVAQHMLKGFVAGGGDEGLVGTPIFFLLKDPPLKLEGGDLQVVKACMIAPWALRPVIGIMSDALPIFGYKKLPYMAITSVAAVICSLLIGLNFATTSVTALLVCAFFVFLQISTIDLLVKARSSEVVKENPSIGPEFMQFQWIGINIGQMIGVLVVGLIIEYNSPRIPYLIAAPFCAMLLWPVLANYHGERKAEPYSLSARNSRNSERCPCLLLLTLLHGLCVCLVVVLVYLMLCDILTATQVFWVCVSVVVLLLSCFVIFLRPEIGSALAFWFLWSMSFFSIEGALFYFYTNDSAQYPDGPHFSKLFYTSGIGFAGLFGVLIGYLTGTHLFKAASYRFIILLTTLLRVVARLFLVPVLLRWTHSSFEAGEALYVMSVVGLDSMFCAWCWIPKEVMMSHLCPSGVEAMVMSLFVGACVFAEIVGGFFGNYLLRVLDIRPCGAKEDALAFDRLWQAQVCTALAPAVVLVLLPFCIPSCNQTDKLLDEESTSASYNSAWERFQTK